MARIACCIMVLLEAILRLQERNGFSGYVLPAIRFAVTWRKCSKRYRFVPLRSWAGTTIGPVMTGNFARQDSCLSLCVVDTLWSGGGVLRSRVASADLGLNGAVHWQIKWFLSHPWQTGLDSSHFFRRCRHGTQPVLLRKPEPLAPGLGR